MALPRGKNVTSSPEIAAQAQEADAVVRPVEQAVEDLAGKVEAVSNKIGPEKSTAKKGKKHIPRCQYEDDKNKVCGRKIPVYLRDINRCRCLGLFCARHYTSVAHGCQVLPEKSKGRKQDLRVFHSSGGSGNCAF